MTLDCIVVAVEEASITLNPSAPSPGPVAQIVIPTGTSPGPVEFKVGQAVVLTLK